MELSLTKNVEKGGTAEPSAETFEFELEDTEQKQKSPGSYGITLLDKLEITTDGTGTFEKTVRVQIDLTKVNENNGWKAYGNAGSQNTAGIIKPSFLARRTAERRDGHILPKDTL